jgi:hypothetical protein
LNESISISTPVIVTVTMATPTDHDETLANGHVCKVKTQASACDEKSKVSLIRYTSEERVDLPLLSMPPL